MELIKLYLILNLAYAEDRHIQNITIGTFEYGNSVTVNPRNEFNGNLVRKIKRKLQKNYNIKFERVPFGRAIELTSRGHLDIFAGLVKTKERMNLVDFSSFPIASITPFLCEKVKRSEAAIGNIVTPRSNYWKMISDKLKLKNVSINLNNRYNERAIGMLLRDRVRFALLPSLTSVPENIKCRMLNDYSRKTYFIFKKGSKLNGAINTIWHQNMLK